MYRIGKRFATYTLSITDFPTPDENRAACKGGEKAVVCNRKNNASQNSMTGTPS
jgi:hypothetical protein